MKKLLFVLFVFSSICSFAQSSEKNFLDVNYIEITGKSIKDITPDMIYLSIVVSENDNKRTVIEETEKKMMKALVGIGVDIKKDFSIKDLQSGFQHYFLKSTDIKLTKEYELIVHTGAMAGKALETLESVGVANVSISKLRYSKIEEVRTLAKIEAIKDAKEKAILLTKEIGQSTGKALYIREQGDYTEYPLENRYNRNRPMYAKASVAMQTEDAPVEIDFQQIKLEYSVLVRFEIK